MSATRARSRDLDRYKPYLLSEQKFLPFQAVSKQRVATAGHGVRIGGDRTAQSLPQALRQEARHLPAQSRRLER